MRELARRSAAAAAAGVLLALVLSDLLVRRVRAWGNAHSLTESVVTSLLVLAIAALIVDEVVANRQRRERAVSVAVQALIVYGQARRAVNAVSDRTEGIGTSPREELRSLATMLLTAAPSLFDDLDARRFLEEAERLSILLVRVASERSGDSVAASLELARARLDASVGPLVSRIPAHDRALLEGLS